jgi:hypothetical protein
MSGLFRGTGLVVLELFRGTGLVVLEFAPLIRQKIDLLFEEYF